MITVYTDGACKGNPGKGGWGVFWSDLEGNPHELYGGETQTTNNRMELMAVIVAMEKLGNTQSKKIMTDSTYVYKGVTEWLTGWKAKEWKNSRKVEVLNKDLWQKLDVLLQASPQTQFAWVKAHNGEPGNERADALANKGVPN